MHHRRTTGTDRPPLAVWLGGGIGIEAYRDLAARLAREVAEPAGRPPTLVLFEPEPAITIGRLGSRADVDLTDDELEAWGLKMRFVGRGGGAVPHGPGQIGIAIFTRLCDVGLGPQAVGAYVERLESALEGAVRRLRCSTARDSRLHGILGRSGLLATVGIAVRRGVVSYGGFLNVQCGLELCRRVRSIPMAVGAGMRTMGSIEADVRRRVRLQDARTAVVENLVEAFDFSRVFIESGWPAPPRPERPGSVETLPYVG